MWQCEWIQIGLPITTTGTGWWLDAHKVLSFGREHEGSFVASGDVS